MTKRIRRESTPSRRSRTGRPKSQFQHVQGTGSAQATHKEPLTARQRQVLDFISTCITSRGFPPTLREIGEHLQIRSTNGVNDHLKALERKGYLQREDLKSRALRPVESSNVASIPLVGDVAAGIPNLAVEHASDTLRMDAALLGSKPDDIFALRVRGDSMIEDGIFDGDLVFVRKQETAKKGETIVALVDNEATVKRFYPEGDRIRLQPANSSMEPIFVSASEGRSVSVLGAVVGIYRRL